MNPEALSALDSVFVTMDAANAPLHIGALIELEAPDGAIADHQERFERIKARVEERLSTIAVLRRRVVRVPFDLGQPILVDDPDFDLSFHIVRRAVPAPGSQVEMDALCARIMATPLAPDRPMWELSVIEGLEGDRTGLLIRLHHALADGVSGVAVFAGLFDLEPEPAATVAIEESGEDDEVPPIPSPVDMLARSSSELLRRPGAILEAIGSSLERLAGRVDELMGVAEAGEGYDAGLFDAPPTSMSGTISHARLFVRLRLDLADVKAAARRNGGTVTDFAVSVVGGALRRLLSERGEHPSKDLIAFVPVNIRRPGTEEHLGNRIAARLVPLDSLIENPFDRFEAVIERSAKAKAREQPMTDVINDLAEAAGPALASFAGKVVSAFELFDLLPPGANVIVSSLPGPTFPLYCAGEQIVSVAPIGPLMFNQGLNVTVLSYCEHIEFGMLACARRVSDVDRFRELLADEVATLLGTDEPAVVEEPDEGSLEVPRAARPTSLGEPHRCDPPRLSG
jgi:WS/DGAT/MGAT family acyltransferase